MNDFVDAQSEKINNSVNMIAERIKLLEDASNKAYEAYFRMGQETEQGNNADDATGAFYALSENTSHLMASFLESDPNKNAEIFITRADGMITNSTKPDNIGKKLSEEEFKSYITKDSSMVAHINYDDTTKELMINYCNSLYTNGNFSGVLVIF